MPGREFSIGSRQYVSVSGNPGKSIAASRSAPQMAHDFRFARTTDSDCVTIQPRWGIRFVTFDRRLTMAKLVLFSHHLSEHQPWHQPVNQNGPVKLGSGWSSRRPFGASKGPFSGFCPNIVNIAATIWPDLG